MLFPYVGLAMLRFHFARYPLSFPQAALEGRDSLPP
jgi:hypothetical protein